MPVERGNLTSHLFTTLAGKPLRHNLRNLQFASIATDTAHTGPNIFALLDELDLLQELELVSQKRLAPHEALAPAYLMRRENLMR